LAERATRRSFRSRSSRSRYARQAMSPEFKVVIRGGDLRAVDALANFNLQVAGAPYREQTGEPISDELQAFIRANSADTARQRVEEKLPPDGDYDIQVIPVDED
jgi:hypothetical protein